MALCMQKNQLMLQTYSQTRWAKVLSTMRTRQAEKKHRTSLKRRLAHRGIPPQCGQRRLATDRAVVRSCCTCRSCRLIPLLDMICRVWAAGADIYGKFTAKPCECKVCQVYRDVRGPWFFCHYRGWWKVTVLYFSDFFRCDPSCVGRFFRSLENRPWTPCGTKTGCDGKNGGNYMYIWGQF